MIAYRVKDWKENFEKAQSRRCIKMNWVAFPNAHDGSGYRRVATHENSVELFTAWVLIVQVASKLPTRGLLVDKNNNPIDAEDLAFRTSFPAKIFNQAFEVLINGQISWLEKVEISDTPSQLRVCSEPTPSAL